jgi:hypothetical protein
MVISLSNGKFNKTNTSGTTETKQSTDMISNHKTKPVLAVSEQKKITFTLSKTKPLRLTQTFLSAIPQQPSKLS